MKINFLILMRYTNKWLPENFKDFDLGFSNQNIFFCNIPKNASTSIRNTLKLSKREIYNNQKYKIVVLRNPFERALSSYHEILKLRTDGPYKETISTDFYKLRNDDYESSFILFLEYINKRMYDSHVHRQCDYIFRKKISIEDFDYVMNFSNLKDDFKKVKDDLLIRESLLFKNKSKKMNKPIIKDDKVISLIDKIYSEDIKLYNKKFNLL
jgi:hypothetical protein